MGIIDKLLNNKEEEEMLPSPEVKALQLQILDLQSQLQGIKNFALDKDNKYKTIEKKVISFCKILLEKEYAISQIGGNDNNMLNKSVLDLLDYVAEKIIKEKKENNIILNKIINEKKEKENIIENLKIQISQLLVNKNMSQQDVMELLMNDKILNINKYKQEENKDKKEEENNKQSTIQNPILNNIITNKEEQKEEEQKKQTEIIDEIEENKKEEIPMRIIEIKDSDLKNKDVINCNLNKEKKDIKKHFGDKETTNVLAHIIDLQETMKELALIHWKIIEAIGTKGLSEKKDITNYVKRLEDFKDINTNNSLDQKIDKALQQLRISNLLKKETINTGHRTFSIFYLTDVGIRAFKESGKFEGDIVESEKDKLVKQHSTASHGYGIKDCAKILEQLHYKDVCYDNKKNKILLSNGDVYIPDIIAINPKTNEKEYFEYELVHHKQSDFERKCEKMRKITNKLNFIVPDIQKKKRLINQIDDWKFNARKVIKDNIDDLEIRVATTRNLINDKWETEF